MNVSTEEKTVDSRWIKGMKHMGKSTLPVRMLYPHILGERKPSVLLNPPKKGLASNL